MKAKQVVRFLLIAFIICIFICNIYIVAYSRGLGYEKVPYTVAYANCFFNLLMGVAILLYGLLVEKDIAHKRTKQIAFIIGSFFSGGSIIAFLITLLSKA